VNVLQDNTRFGLTFTRVRVTKGTLFVDKREHTWNDFLEIIKITRLSNATWKGKIVLDKWIDIIDGILVVEHMFTHRY
jgi:hypothetical protein